MYNTYNTYNIPLKKACKKRKFMRSANNKNVKSDSAFHYTVRHVVSLHVYRIERVPLI